MTIASVIGTAVLILFLDLYFALQPDRYPLELLTA